MISWTLIIVLCVIGTIGLYLNESDKYHSYWNKQDKRPKVKVADEEFAFYACGYMDLKVEECNNIIKAYNKRSVDEHKEGSK